MTYQSVSNEFFLLTTEADGFTRAARLDREADALLQMGQHAEAERRAWRAEAIRAGEMG